MMKMPRITRLLVWKYRVLHAWRRLIGRCELCGSKRAPLTGDVWTIGPFCRKCNKTVMWAQVYGAGPRTLQRLHERLSRGEDK